MGPFVALNMTSVLTHVGVGMGAASFWRGAWYVLDDHLFPGSPVRSASASLVLGTGGMALSQGLVHKMELLQQKIASKSTTRRVWTLKVARFGALYTIAMSCVLVWRGAWLGWDVVYEYAHPEQHVCQQTNLKRINSTDPGHATTSGILSHMLAVAVLAGTGLFASVLAPPAASSIVRDLTVRAGSKAYSGPAQRVWQQFAGIGGGGANSASAARTTAPSPATWSLSSGSNPTFAGNRAQSLLARSYQTRPTMSRLNNTTRIATSVHKY